MVSDVRQPRAARHRDARDLQGRLRDESRRRRPADGLPRREPPRPGDARAQGGRRPGDLREVRGRGSEEGPDEDLPGHALFDGRALGGLRADDERARPLRRRRGRLPVSRRQPARRQLAALLPLQRADRRAGDGGPCPGALRRDESRGAHYKPEFPNRDDARWLRTTKARWTSDGPQFSYEPVDVSLIPPRPRKYDTTIGAGARG